MTRQLLGARAAAFQRHQQPRLHLRLGARDLGLGQGFHRVVDDIDDHLHHLGRIAGVGAGIEPEKSGIGVGRMESVDRIAQSALFAHFLEQPRRHPAAERVGEDLQGKQRQIGLRHALQRQCQMRLLELAVHHARAALAEHRRLRLWRGRAVKTCELLRHFLDHPLVIDRAGGRHHHVGPAIMRRQIAAQRIAVKTLQRFGRPQQRAAHRLVRVTQFVEVFEHDVIGRILRRPDLLHDDALFALQLIRHE